MFFQSSQELQDQSNQKKIKELQVQWERLTEDIDSFFLEHGLDLNALHEHFENQENFSSAEWHVLQEMQQENDQRLEMRETKQADARATKQKYQTLSDVSQHWLFVR